GVGAPAAPGTGGAGAGDSRAPAAGRGSDRGSSPTARSAGGSCRRGRGFVAPPVAGRTQPGRVGGGWGLAQRPVPAHRAATRARQLREGHYAAKPPSDLVSLKG